MPATQPINLIEIETRWGYRSFELYHADVTKLDFSVDLLTGSAFAGGYRPTPGSIAGSLATNCDIHMDELQRQPWLDFRSSLGCWISGELDHPKFNRILGVEIIGRFNSVGEAVENVFASLSAAETKGLKAATIVIPLLGAGLQKLDPEEIIRHLLPKALDFLKKSPVTSRICFVSKHESQIDILNQAMNDLLGRVKIVLPKGPLIADLRREILTGINRLRSTGLDALALLSDLERIISSEASRSFEIGIIARRLVEKVVDDVLGESKGDIDLFAKIERTATVGIASWTRSYMHTLRVFGNESAHERDMATRVPATIDESDLALCLFCIQRVIEFYGAWRKPRGDA